MSFRATYFLLDTFVQYSRSILCNNTTCCQNESICFAWSLKCVMKPISGCLVMLKISLPFAVSPSLTEIVIGRILVSTNWSTWKQVQHGTAAAKTIIIKRHDCFNCCCVWYSFNL